MGSTATAVYEQITLLQERGMDITSEHKAAEYLLDIGYYRLGFYWYYFEADRATHAFVPGTRLDDVIKLYYFDVDLRNLLSKYLYRIEVNFRTKLVYYTSNKYRDSPTWFQDIHIVDRNFRPVLSKIYTKNFIKYNLPLKKHHQKYINDKYAPAWKTLEFFTFGQAFRLYKALKDDTLKQEIASTYGLNKIGVFQSFIQTLINLRNICSHSAVLFDYNQPLGVRKIPDNRYTLKTRNRTNLNASLRVVRFMLSSVSTNRTRDLETELYELFKMNIRNKNLRDIILQTTGVDFFADK